MHSKIKLSSLHYVRVCYSKNKNYLKWKTYFISDDVQIPDHLQGLYEMFLS